MSSINGLEPRLHDEDFVIHSNDSGLNRLTRHDSLLYDHVVLMRGNTNDVCTVNPIVEREHIYEPVQDATYGNYRSEKIGNNRPKLRKSENRKKDKAAKLARKRNRK